MNFFQELLGRIIHFIFAYMNKTVRKRVKYSDDAKISHWTNPTEKKEMCDCRQVTLVSTGTRSKIPE